MFKQRLVFKIEGKEVVNFCRLIGKYGLKFKIGGLRKYTDEKDMNKIKYYREFVVFTSKRKAYKLYDEINMMHGCKLIW